MPGGSLAATPQHHDFIMHQSICHVYLLDFSAYT